MEKTNPFLTKIRAREERILPTTVRKYSYDLFLSFPDEDKQLATTLHDCLRKRCASTWFSKEELRKGSSIMATINEAMLCSKNAVILLTPHTLAEARHFPLLEIYALYNQFLYNELEQIFMVYHQVDHRFIVRHLPLLADHYSFSTQQGLANIAAEITTMIA